ncbi:tetratricopeptide repeat protein [Streptomyces sp. NPDC001401]|uniref:tetratricopeptide repeat protein n=1 Tax=Streptomyces sp. NPDC001401 TaxID=3364570 RepID=UPI00368BB174
MARLSREKKQEQKRAEGSAALVAAPIDVRVPEAGPVGAWIGGVPVTAAAGEEIQQAVLNHLHRIALATGHPVHATVHDERIGYVVHLQVDTDGASSFTGEPVGMTAPAGGPRDAVEGPPPPPPVQSLPPAPPSSPAEPEASAAAVEPRRPEQQPQSDKPTHVLRASAEPAREAAPTFPLRAVSEPQPLGENVPTFPLGGVPEPPADSRSAPTFTLRALPEPPQDRAPGTVAAPTGEFGPPPPMDAVPQRAPEPGREDAPAPRQEPAPAPDRSLTGSLLMVPPDPALDPDPKPTPARGFDAVAEAVLGDEPPTAPAFLAEPMAQINEAVKAGRTETAAALAETTVEEASAALGPEHAEVLRLRELTAYIAYLAGEPVRAFRVSLDLARIHRRARDAEAAYGNIQSAASAWRAVRDPQQGLDLGRDLIGLWSELAAEGGPAAEDIERLESARARMGRLTERARKSAQQPPS